MRIIRPRFVAFLIFIFALTAQGCAPSVSARPDSRIRDGLLGTVIAISIYEEPDDAIVNEVFAIIEEIDHDMSVTNPSSELSRVNKAAGIGPAPVKDSVYEVIALAAQIARDTGGAFDMTVGPLVSLWAIGTENARVPSGTELQKALELVGYEYAELDSERRSVYLKKEGMEVNLGAIAKGYAGDMAAEAVRAHGIESAILDLGGNIVTIGRRPDGDPWRIAIRTPVPGNGGNVGIVHVSDKAVITSGGYERYFEQGGKTYHHILDPHTGYPANSGLLSVTIVSDSSTEADMLSTAAFVLGYDRGLELVESYGAEAVFITDEKNVYITEGLTDIFALTNDEFSLMVVS